MRQKSSRNCSEPLIHLDWPAETEGIRKEGAGMQIL